MRVGATSVLSFAADPVRACSGCRRCRCSSARCPAGGTLDLPVTIGPLGGLQATRFYLQAVVVTSQAKVVLGGGSAIELISAAIPVP